MYQTEPESAVFPE